MMPTIRFINSCTTRLLLVACLFLRSLQGGLAQTKEDVEVTASMAQAEDPNSLFLEFTLANNTQGPLVLALSDLPTEWNRFSVVVAVVLTAYPKTLTPLTPLIFPLMGSITIPAGEKLTKRINLSDRFPELNTSLLKGDALVLWAYRPNIPAQEHSAWFSGSVLLRKRERP